MHCRYGEMRLRNFPRFNSLVRDVYPDIQARNKVISAATGHSCDSVLRDFFTKNHFISNLVLDSIKFKKLLELHVLL